MNDLNTDEENLLALRIQKQFPLCQEPYHELAQDLQLEPDAVLGTLRRWKEEGKLREISAVMEGYLLGYDSALVCAAVVPERLSEVAAIVSSHPTVTHNYERNHSYNLWFTIAVPHSMGLENHLQRLRRLTGVGAFHALRRLETFKVGVAFDFKSGQNSTESEELAVFDPETMPLPAAHLVRLAQRDLPIVRRPFEELAGGRKEGQELLDFLQQEKGRMVRRYIGTFRHRKMGIRSNGMTVFQVDPVRLTEIGQKLASFPAVSHCYARNTCPGFPYNLYAMLHAPDSAALNGMASEIAQSIGITDYLILESPTEFKKTRLRYFLPELDQWWLEHQYAA